MNSFLSKYSTLYFVKNFMKHKKNNAGPILFKWVPPLEKKKKTTRNIRQVLKQINTRKFDTSGNLSAQE